MSLPWYKWYAADWVRCETRFEMTLAQRGMFRELLDLHYLEGSIPKNPRVLSGFLVANPEEFQAAWEVVSKQFVQHPENDDRLINLRAFEEIAAMEAMRNRQKENGLRGGRPKKPTKNPRVSSGLAKRKPSESESDTESERRDIPPTPLLLDWSPWPDAEAAREAILDAYPSKSDQYGARVYWRQFLDDAQHLAPGQARSMFAAATMLDQRCPPEKVQFLPSARKFVEGRWSDDWAKIIDAWTKRDDEGEFTKTMRALEEARRTA